MVMDIDAIMPGLEGSRSFSKHSNLVARFEEGDDEDRSPSPLHVPVQGTYGNRRAPDPDVLASLLDHIKAQEARISNLEGDRKTDIEVGHKGDFRTEASDEIEEQGSTLHLGPSEIIPKIRKCNIAQFKNRFNVQEGRYAVDVLESNSLLDEEIQDELKLRQSLPKAPSKHKEKRPKVKIAPAATMVDQAIHTGQTDAKWISRIRIQSPAILAILSRIMRESWTGRPRTYFRPFSPLIYFHEQATEALKDLEAKWGHAEHPGAIRTPASRDDASEHQGEVRFPVDDSPSALAEMRCYIQFITDEIMPLYNQFDKLDDTSSAKVRFHDLWFLFRPGELVYRPIGTGTNKDAGGLAIGQRTWRAYGTRPFWPKYQITPVDHRKYMSDDDDEENSAFAVFCYYIDYTGDEFCAVKDRFEIQPYDGERPIKSLVVYPWRFVTDHKEKLKKYMGIGGDFFRYIQTKHAAYDWWTMTRDPRGGPAIDVEGNVLKRPEHINSEVIVDFVEAFQACPAWKPQQSIIKNADPRPSTTADEFYTCWWSDAERTKLLAETTEIIVLRTGVTTYERNKAVREDEFLAKIRENDRNNRPTTSKDLRESDMVLLPVRVFAYALQDRKFVQLDCQYLRPVKESFNAFDSLKINPRHKAIVQGLVEAHFLKKSKEKTDGMGRLTLDLIQGKGKGLFILLHGVPGVGKTATAEAVAQANGKPLFAITCGDLGLTPNKVEAALRRIFRLANAWDCVLLLDEVDTFFSQRSKGDATLTKNALVSVFLRVLEYYNGLLFLTTNRPGALDEAFKSRIHLKLYYPPLDFEQTRDIWQMNLERLHAMEEQRCAGSPDEQPLQIHDKEILDFAVRQFCHDDGKARWNGRQIRNAFQIASSLAYFDARKRHAAQLRERAATDSDAPVPAPRPVLDVEHFEMIHRITDDFDQYMLETVGNTDGALAFERDDRADHWKSPRPSGAAENNNRGYFEYGQQTQTGGRAGSGWGHGPPRASPPAGRGVGLGFEDGNGRGDPGNRPQHSPNPSYGRPSLAGGSSHVPSFSFDNASRGPPGGDREYYSPFGGPGRLGSGGSVGYGGNSNDGGGGAAYIPPESVLASAGSGLRGYGRDEHERAEIGPRQGSRYGSYGAQNNEWGNSNSRSEDQGQLY